MLSFFKGNKDLIKNTCSILIEQIEGDNVNEKINFSHSILDSMLNYNEDWDAYCNRNIQWVGKNFIEALTYYKENYFNDKSGVLINKLFNYLLRFSVEMNLSYPNDFSNLNLDFVALTEFSLKKGNDIDGKSRWVIHALPMQLFKDLVNSSDLTSILAFPSIIEDAEKKEALWTENLEQREERVNALNENIKKLNSSYNFMGLHSGFNELNKEKEKERKSLFSLILFLAILITIPMLSELLYISLHADNLEKVTNLILISFVPAASLTALLVYYFRVVFHEYKSVKSQILQIELRKTLCAFIESYSEFSKVISKDNQKSLDKFENVIFSAIMANDEKIPSTFDGINNFATLIKSVKS